MRGIHNPIAQPARQKGGVLKDKISHVNHL